MAELSEIVKAVRLTCDGMERNSQVLQNYSIILNNKIIEIQSLIEGTSSLYYHTIVSSLQHAIHELNVSSERLNFAALTGRAWATGHGNAVLTSTSLNESNSATNSYARAQLTEQEANVFLREKSDIERPLISWLSAARAEAVDSAYADAPSYITALINKFCNGLQGFYDSKLPGQCWYSPSEKSFYMDESMNHAEYTDVLKHEMGHFVDHMLGSVSGSPEFLAAMNRDLLMYNQSTAEGRLKMVDMLDDLFNTGACFDRNVTDILSAFFRNDVRVINRFDQESVTGYVAYYKHGNNYWDKCDADGKSLNLRGKEIFANCFAIETDCYRISHDFVERWFPNTFARMQILLTGGIL